MINILLTTVLVAATPSVEARTLDGKTAQGELVKLTTDSLVLRNGKSEQTISAADLMAVDVQPAPAAVKTKATVWIELVDGSRLSAISYTVGDGTASATLTEGGAVAIPTRDLRAVRLKSQTPDLAKQFQAIVDGDAKADRIVIRRGTDRIASLEGVLRNATAEHVEFELDGETVPVRRAKVEGLVYYHRDGRKLSPTTCVVTDASGQRVAATQITLLNNVLQIVTPTGFKLTRPLALVTRLDFAAGKLKFLSDMKPERTQWTPYFGPARPQLARLNRPREDQSTAGGPLTLRMRDPDNPATVATFAKGVSMRSRTLLVYRLPGPFRSFRAIAGIDPRIRRRGNVRLVIHGDEKQLFEATLTSGGEPVPIRLDLRGVARLKILVDFGENQDVGDHVNLCDARIIK